jgi:hypothetical protein
MINEMDCTYSQQSGMWYSLFYGDDLKLVHIYNSIHYVNVDVSFKKFK